MNIDGLKQQFLPKYLEVGDQKFRQFLIVYAMSKLVAIEKGIYNGVSPDLELLYCYDQFLVLFRREGEDNYMKIAKVFRSVAHKVHRIMSKKKMVIKNPKFLSLV